MISRRQILLSSAAVAACTSPAFGWTHGSGAIAIPVNVWMEAPDILAFYVDDAPIIKGNSITLSSPSGQPYDTPFQMTNPLTGNSEWCFVIGPTKTTIRFVDRPIPSYVNKVDLHTLANYSMTGGPSITGVYFRDEALDAGLNYVGAAQTFLCQFRHTVYLQLSSTLSNGVTYRVSNSASPFVPFSFTYNDKLMRAGGLKASQFGVRNDDTFKKVYLASRVPGAPNAGVIDFAGTYGITTAQIIDAVTKATVATVNVNIRRAWNQIETGDFYSSGFDVADTSVGYAVTGITKANPAVVTCPSHPFVNGDKCRFHGIAGMTQIEGTGTTSLWIAPTITVIDANSFSINLNTSAFTAFSATPIFSTALGGVSNVVYKCFNTNRAGTNTYECDLSSFTTLGNYYIYIPGYGISDPFYVGTEAYAIAAGNIHQGFYNMRLGCDVTASPGYSRPLASVDGVNGTAIYQSLLPAPFSSECVSILTPTGANTPFSGSGAYSDEGTLALASQIWSSSIVTATTVAPHGIPGPYPTFYPLTVVNSLPGTQTATTLGGYNFVSQGAPNSSNWATITGASTFTYPVAANPGLNTQLGVARTGFLTSTRVTGFREAHQDAGDNDGLSCDHMAPFQSLAWVFNNISANSRFTPFTVQLSTSLLNPTLYAGTNGLPPLFHEIVWYADNYRVFQDANGQVPGGTGLGHFSSQIPDYPEPIQLNSGIDPLGNRAGQTTMCFMYASDHWGTMQYAALAAQIALICQGYGTLTTLATTWFNSAVAAYNRAHDLMSDITKRDAYYVSQLNLPTKMGWSTAQYNEVMGFVLNNGSSAGLGGRCVVQQHAAAAALYRYLGPTSGQSPYGDMIEGKTLSGNPSIGTGSGGTGYVVGDLLTLSGGTLITGGAPAIVRVTAAPGGVISSVVTYFPGEYSVAPTTPITVSGGSGTMATLGTASFLFTYNIMATENPNTGAFDYSVTPGNNATAKTYLLNHSSGSAAANSAFYTSSATSFNLMISPTSSDGSNNPNSPLPNLIAHMIYVYQSGASPGSSQLLQSMSAHVQWLMGANMVGKCMAARLGVRSVNSFLHEDYWKMGISAPPGIVPLTYFAWAVAGLGAFNGSGTTTDKTSTYIADNITGTQESAAQPGSTKMWSNWRFGEAYWEYEAENRGTNDFVCEYTLANLLVTAAIALYCHGWDGNV